jgi:hypothetical protein
MKNKKEQILEQDIAGLLELKKFERPEARRTEKNIQNIMRTVRTTNNVPSLLFFPDKSFAWMFAQPRYGIAALFVIFLGMNLLNRPSSGLTASPAPIIKMPGPEIIASVDTNQLKAAAIPGIKPAFSVAGESDALSSYIK